MKRITFDRNRGHLKPVAGVYGRLYFGNRFGHLVMYQIMTDSFTHVFVLGSLLIIVAHCRSQYSLRPSRY